MNPTTSTTILTIIDFMQNFSSDESCKTYLADRKRGDGFVCHRCGHDHAVKGRTRQHRCCGSCRFDESASPRPLPWFTKRRVPLAMKACEEPCQLTENLEVEEAFLGGREEGKRGRSKGSKSLVLVSVEVGYSHMTRRKAKLKRCCATVIENASGASLKQVLEASVEASAVVNTDGWKGYLSALTGKWHNVEDSAQGALRSAS